MKPAGAQTSRPGDARPVKCFVSQRGLTGHLFVAVSPGAADVSPVLAQGTGETPLSPTCSLLNWLRGEHEEDGRFHGL